MTPEEHREVLDGRLQVALSEFDEMLLGQQRELEEKQRDDPLPGRQSPATAGGGASGGAPAGPDPRSGGREAGARGGSQGADTATGGSRDAGGPEGGEASTGGVEGQAGQGDPRVPPDVGDGSDDDVVARQLREAAMKEDDPVLREKLWDEYREYKKSAGS
jgi:hypothetical protein